MTELDEIRARLQAATRVPGQVRPRPGAAARLREAARRRRYRTIGSGAAALSACAVVAVVVVGGGLGAGDGRTAVPATQPTASASPTPSGAISVAPGPRRLALPIEVRSVQREYLTLACNPLPAGTLPAVDGHSCYRLGPAALVIRSVRDLSTGLSSTANGTAIEDGQLNLTLGDADRASFSSLTGRSVGKQLALVVDGRVWTAPVVAERIDGGQLQVPLDGDASRQVLAALLG